MERLTVTIVGQDILELADSLFRENKVNPVNRVKESKLGNFRTFTYIFEFDENDFIKRRRDLLNSFGKETTHLLPMYCYHDWSQIYIFKKIAFRT